MSIFCKKRQHCHDGWRNRKAANTLSLMHLITASLDLTTCINAQLGWYEFLNFDWPFHLKKWFKITVLIKAEKSATLRSFSNLQCIDLSNMPLRPAVFTRHIDSIELLTVNIKWGDALCVRYQQIKQKCARDRKAKLLLAYVGSKSQR